MSFIPKPQEIYKHFKGNLYQITAVAEHTETGEVLVVYQALYGDFRTYARPIDMFVSRVDRDRYPDAEQEFRFELQGPDADRRREERLQECRDVHAAGEAVERNPAQTGTNPKADKKETVRIGTESEADKKETVWTDTEPKADEKGAVQTGTDREETGTDVAQADSAVEEEPAIDPLVLEFLDADSYEQQLNILAGLHHRITDDMITTMAIACDIEINDGDIEERYEALRSCLLTLEKYECNRLR